MFKPCCESARILSEYLRDMRMIQDGTHPELIAAKEKCKNEKPIRLDAKSLFCEAHPDSLYTLLLKEGKR